jgi:hypothetical protein
LPLSIRLTPGGHAPDCTAEGVGVPLTCTVKAKGAPATSSRERLRQVGGVRDVLTTRTRAQRSAAPVEEFRAEQIIENRPVLCGSPDITPLSPPGPLAKTTPGGKWPLHLMLPVDGAVTVGLGSMSRKAFPFKAL